MKRWIECLSNEKPLPNLFWMSQRLQSWIENMNTEKNASKVPRPMMVLFAKELERKFLECKPIIMD